jgi:hypothetical protein
VAVLRGGFILMGLRTVTLKVWVEQIGIKVAVEIGNELSEGFRVWNSGTSLVRDIDYTYRFDRNAHGKV